MHLQPFLPPIQSCIKQLPETRDTGPNLSEQGVGSLSSGTGFRCTMEAKELATIKFYKILFIK